MTGYKGRLTYVGNSNSNTRFGAFDPVGRVLASTQSTAGTAYGPFAYTYNLAGALATETYPSGTVLTNFYDTAGRVNQVQGTKGGVNTNFAQSVSYVPQGVSTLTLGNGLTETWSYLNAQKQPTALAAGGKLTLGWGYGADSTNNGNIQSATIVTAPPTGTALNATQAFSCL